MFRFKAFAVALVALVSLVSVAGADLPKVRADQAPVPQLPANALAVPLVVQASISSCGAGALLAVLYYWNAYDGVETQLYPLLGTTDKDGTEPPKIAEVAAKFGLTAELKTNLTIPDLRQGLNQGWTIILDIQSGTTTGDWKDVWEEGHYVVLVGMDDSYAYFMDPALEKSYEYVPLPELVERWHDYENRNGVIQRYVQAAIVIHGTRPTASFPGPLVRLGTPANGPKPKRR